MCRPSKWSGWVELREEDRRSIYDHASSELWDRLMMRAMLNDDGRLAGHWVQEIKERPVSR